MLEIAVNEFHVPLVMVMGHNRLPRQSANSWMVTKGAPGAYIASAVLSAVYRAKAKRPEDLYLQAIREKTSCKQSSNCVEIPIRLRTFMLDGTNLSPLAPVYHMEDGTVEILEPPDTVYGPVLGSQSSNSLTSSAKQPPRMICVP